MSRAERGERQPALTTVFLLAKALRCAPSTLVSDTHAILQVIENSRTR